MKLLLFGTQGCHLCEQAEVLLREFQSDNNNLTIKHIDIADHQEWFERYSLRIPVLLDSESDFELGWPFDLLDLGEYIHKLNSYGLP